MVNTHGDCKSPKDRVVGPLPNGRFMAYIYIYGGDPFTTYDTWDDPPSANANLFDNKWMIPKTNGARWAAENQL